MDITKEEYKLLRKFYKSEFLIINNAITDILIDKKLIAHKTVKINRDGSPSKSDELVITNEGKIAYEKYFEDHREMRRTAFHARAALIVSIFAIAIAGADLFFNHILSLIQ